MLALLSEQQAHGWALANELAPAGKLGVIWSLTHPAVYKALETLEEHGLIESLSTEPGVHGRKRTFKATPAGRAALNCWLENPVEHIRDSRSQLLLKLAVAERAGIDPEPMLAAQHASIVAMVETLEARARSSSGSETLVIRFRLESTRAVLRFINDQIAECTKT